jgi:hypothetical protein
MNIIDVRELWILKIDIQFQLITDVQFHKREN